MKSTQSSEIRSDTVPTLIHDIYLQEASGKLALCQGATEKNLFFEKGRVVFASSTVRDDRLDQAVLSRGLISLPHLMEAVDESLRSGKRLGAVLLERKWIRQADLEKVLEDQLKEIVFSVFLWESGTLEFVENFAGSGEKVRIQAHPNDLILQGIRRIPSLARVYAQVGGLNTEYLTTRDAPRVVEEAHLQPAEQKVVSFCEQTRTLTEICQEVPLNDFSLCKVVWGLVVIQALIKA